MNTLRTFAHTLLLATLLPTTACAQEGGTSAKEENPGYFHGGLNYSLNTVVPRAGLTLGLGSEFFFGNYVAERLRFGLNMGWFTLSSNFGDRGRISAELQALKPGFLFSAKLTDDLRIDVKYSAMPTYNITFDTDNDEGLDRGDYSSWGVQHGPYAGITFKRFMAGFELVTGTLDTEVHGSTYRINDYRRNGNSFRVMVGINY